MRIYSAAKKVLRRLGVRVMREGRLPRGLDATVDLREIDAAVPVRFVVDVGANVGQSVQRFLEEFPECRILSCEPSAAAFETLTNRFGGNERVACRNVALGEMPGFLDFEELGPGAEKNRVLRLPRMEGSTVVRVAVETLDGILSSMGDPVVDLLKIDVEGFELAVLRGGVASIERGRVRAILAECTFDQRSVEHTHFKDLEEWLAPRGFSLLGLYDVHHLHGRMHYANALFYRPRGRN